jgi:uncharacterized protein (DUF2062 family)
MAISLGVIIGMFPVQGTTTIICTLVSILFRLNLVVLQLANYLSFPIYDPDACAFLFHGSCFVQQK